MFSIPIISLLDCLSPACIFFGAQDCLCHVGLSSASGKSFARSQENVAESSLINNKENIKYFSFSQVDTCFLFGYSLKRGATWNRLKPAETTQNHLKLPKTTQNNLQPPQITWNQPYYSTFYLKKVILRLGLSYYSSLKCFVWANVFPKLNYIPYSYILI